MTVAARLAHHGPDARVGVPVTLVESPSGQRQEIPLDVPLSLDEAGFYEITLPGHDAWPVAVNVDPAESDLTMLDAQAFVAASTAGAATDSVRVAANLTRAQREQRQGVWWFLLLAGLLLLAAESLWSNRLGLSGPAGSGPG